MLPSREPDVIKKYQLTNLTNNNNKWWTIKWWKQEQIAEIQYGRVGQACVRPALKKDIGEKQFNKLIRDREKPKEEGTYKEVTTGIKVNRTADTSGLSQKLVKRIEAIFKAANQNIDSFLNMNVNDLSLDQIEKGKLQLNNIFSAFADFEKKKHLTKNTAIDNLVEQARIYLEIIPTKLPAKINAIHVAVNLGEHLAEEMDKLLQLEAAVSSHKVDTAGGSILDQLGCKLEECTDDEYKAAEKYFLDTRKHVEHSKLQVKEVWRVEIQQERKYFLDYPKKDNIKQLWHGTNPANVKHILHKKGLIIPAYASNGSAYGRGAYFADVATKSINYCGYSKEKYLFLADVVLGRQYPAKSTLSWTKCIDGYDSVFAEGDKPMSGIYNGYLRHSEFIIYRTEQQTIRYLVVIS